MTNDAQFTLSFDSSRGYDGDVELEAIFREALERCDPARLVKDHLHHDPPRNIVAIGKCAGALLDGAEGLWETAFVAIPEGYRLPTVERAKVEIAIGGHPDLTEASFDAGERLVRYVKEHHDVLFLISGGGSACVDVARQPFDQKDLIAANRALVASNRSIHDINVVRRHLSAIKGGRLAQLVRGRCITFVLSDVAGGALADVASGPTIADDSTDADAAAILETIEGCERIANKLRELDQGPVPSRHAPGSPGIGLARQLERGSHTQTEVELLADNSTLTAIAAEVVKERGLTPHRWESQIEIDVDQAVTAFIDAVATLPPGEILIAGGEPTIVHRGSGKGGRCCELAARFLLSQPPGVSALFAGSDGRDGNSGVAGFEIPAEHPPVDREAIRASLDNSDSFRAVRRYGRPIMISAANNLRDLYLLARG